MRFLNEELRKRKRHLKFVPHGLRDEQQEHRVKILKLYPGMSDQSTLSQLLRLVWPFQYGHETNTSQRGVVNKITQTCRKFCLQTLRIKTMLKGKFVPYTLWGSGGVASLILNPVSRRI
jgi:hypothetical protein